jgi:hypothetical protein
MRNIRLVTMLTLVGAGLLFGPRAASAQTCINDVWKAHSNSQDLTCTANDVTLSAATNINITVGGSCNPTTGVCQCFAGQPLTFTADFRMDLTAQARYDVGFYLATDGDPNNDGALTGVCSASASLAGNTQNGTFINLDSPVNGGSQPTDVCGDITGQLNTAHNPIFVRATVNTTCPAAAGQQLQLPFATTWRQTGANQVCLGTGNGTTTNDVFPGSPSKCNKGVLTLDITSVTTSIVVTKEALTPSVQETGGSAAYSVKVQNTSAIAVTLQTLTDDKYGNITSTHLAGGGFQAVTATTCATGGSIAAGGEYNCQFTGTVPPGDFPGNFTDIVTACANNATNQANECKSDDAVVPYADVPQPPSLTKTVTGTSCVVDATYTVVVTNNSAQDKLTLTQLLDDVYGDITQVQGNIQSTTCGQVPGSPGGGAGVLPFEIAASGNYSCSFVGRINSCNTQLKDTVSGSATDDDNRTYTSNSTPPLTPDDATVVVTVTTP